MNVSRPENTAVIAYLAGHPRAIPSVVKPGGLRDPYYTLGSHPDIVERLWDELATGTLKCCRRVVCGSPALLQPKSGIIFGLAMGTQYALRLPEELPMTAVRAGAKTHNRWSDGNETNLQELFGPDWVFGAWLKQEPEWCIKAFHYYAMDGSV